jgi:hypothetical protein
MKHDLFAGSFAEIFDRFHGAGRVMTALIDGQPQLLDWEIRGHCAGAFRVVRIADGQAVEQVAVINAPESERPRYEAICDLAKHPIPTRLVFAGKDGAA